MVRHVGARLCLTVVLGIFASIVGVEELAAAEPTAPIVIVYFCPMHPDIRSSIESHCPRCKMSLARTQVSGVARSYSCPLHPGFQMRRPGVCARCGEALLPDVLVPKYEVDFQTQPLKPHARSEVQFSFKIREPKTGTQVKDFYSVHEKLFHLFIINRDLDDYQHIHPRHEEDGTFTIAVTLPREGHYEIVSDFFPVGGTPQLIRRTLATAGAEVGSRKQRAKLVRPSDLDRSIEGVRFRLTFDPPRPPAGEPVLLKYQLTDEPTGRPIRDLRPYLGAWGHTVVMSEDTREFVHSHPTASVSANAQSGSVANGPDVSFETFFPEPGLYRIWSQFQRGDQVKTVSFDVDVLRREFLAVWRKQGWAALTPAPEAALNGAVRAVAFSGTDLYVGGDFTHAGSVQLNGVGRWDGRRWSALGTGVNGSVWAIAINGKDVYIGGDFKTAGKTLVNGIARWNGSSWSHVRGGVRGCRDVQCSPTVYALAAVRGHVYAAGRFVTAGGVPANGVAKWDGSQWSSLGAGVNTGVYDGVVRALVVRDSKVYIGGSFKSAGGINSSNIAVWDGRRWGALGDGLSGGLEQVLTLATRGTEVLAGGNFSRAGAVPASNAALWNGQAWRSLDIHTNGPIQNITADGRNVYFGGGVFTLPSGKTLYGVVRWDSGVWSELDSHASTTYISPITSMVVTDNELIVGGGPFVLPSRNTPARRGETQRPRRPERPVLRD